MPVETIFTAPLVREVILPFLLIFVLIFAILDRTKILGEDKRQINALVSLAIGLIFITFSKAVGIVINLVPFLAIMAVVILVFLILYGFIGADKEGLKIPKGVVIAGGIVVIVALVIAVIIITDFWTMLTGFFAGGTSSKVVTTIVFLAIIGGAIAIVLSTGKK